MAGRVDDIALELERTERLVRADETTARGQPAAACRFDLAPDVPGGTSMDDLTMPPSPVSRRA